MTSYVCSQTKAPVTGQQDWSQLWWTLQCSGDSAADVSRTETRGQSVTTIDRALRCSSTGVTLTLHQYQGTASWLALWVHKRQWLLILDATATGRVVTATVLQKHNSQSGKPDRNVCRILVRGVNAPLLPEAKKIWLWNGALWSISEPICGQHSAVLYTCLLSKYNINIENCSFLHVFAS